MILFQPPHIVERSHMVNSIAWKVQQQHVTAFDGALDPWNQDNAALGAHAASGCTSSCRSWSVIASASYPSAAARSINW